MYKFLFKFAVTTVTILTVNLMTSKISDYLVTYKNSCKPLTFTLIAMAIITLIFYPLFTRMEVWVNQLSANFMIRSGQSKFGKFLGLLGVYLFCLTILFYFYAKMWYHIDLMKAIFTLNFNSLF
jgi:hypothetical protein